MRQTEHICGDIRDLAGTPFKTYFLSQQPWCYWGVQTFI